MIARSIWQTLACLLSILDYLYVVLVIHDLAIWISTRMCTGIMCSFTCLYVVLVVHN